MNRQLKTMRLSQSFNLVIILLALGGMWPPEKINKRLKIFSFYPKMTKYFFLYPHFFFQLIGLYFLLDDLDSFTQSVQTLMMTLLATAKFYYFFHKIDQMEYFAKLLDEKTFSPKNLVQKKQIKEGLKLWYLFFGVFAISSATTASLLLIYPLISGGYKEYQLSFRTWYPYNHENILMYTLSMLHQFVAFFCVLFVNIGLDGYVSFVMAHAGAQCDILGDSLEHVYEYSKEKLKIPKGGFEERILQNEYDGGIAHMMNLLLAENIVHYQKIIKFIDDFEQLIDSNLMMQFVVSLVAICMTLLKFTLMEFKQLVKYLTGTGFMIGASAQLFIYCFFGNEVSQKSSALPDLMFKSKWLNGNKKFKLNLQLFIMRTQKFITISTLKFFPLNIATFSAIIKSSYSYFAVINRLMKNPK